ncbi:terminase family protein [bacterium]|nr:terminase family protein [bacterium]
MAYSDETILEVGKLYKKGHNSAEIESLTGVSTRTQRTWRRKFKWEGPDPFSLTEARYLRLLETGGKTPDILEEIQVLHGLILRQHVELEKLAFKQQQTPGNRSDRRREERKGGRKKLQVNSFEGTDLDAEKAPVWDKYQQEFLDDESEERFVLKSRQIGFSFVVAWEALIDANETGRNQIFISASRNQVGQIRSYIVKFAKRCFGVKLTGKDVIEFTNANGDDVELRFLSTNARTAQGYHGNVYIDEICHIPKLKEVMDYALAMATLDQYRLTYFSTPSYKSHYSYNIWEGIDEFGNKVKDVISRTKITIFDAIKKGCKRINLEKIKRRFTPRQFKFLFLCEWVDDTNSFFKAEDLEACYYSEPKLDAKGKPVRDKAGNLVFEFADLPEFEHVGYPIYVGYDPNGGTSGGDNASIAIGVHLPNDRLRVFKHIPLIGKSINFQAAAIRDVVQKYRPDFLGIDVTGVGQAVWNVIKGIEDEVDHPMEVKLFNYSRELKINLVLRLERIVANRQLEIQYDDTLLIQSFLAIKVGTTDGGNPTIIANRKSLMGHADLFWAIAHLASKFPVVEYSDGGGWGL